MTDLEETLRRSGGAPSHGADFEARLWAAIRAVDAETAQAAGQDTRGRPLAWRLRSRHLWRRHPLLIAASVAVASVAVAVVLLVGLPGAPGPETVSAAGVLDRALAAYSSLRTWQADLHLKWYDEDIWRAYHTYGTRRAHIVQDADGSHRETYSPVMAADHVLMAGSTEVYDATTGREGPSYDGSEGSWGVETNSPLGPPDAGTIPFIDMATTVRALASSRTLRLGQTVVGGRPAWTVTCTKAEMAGLPPGGEAWPAYTVLVDKQTWLLLGVREVTSGRLTLSGQYRNLRVNEPLPADAFTAAAPPGAHVTHVDLGFHRMPLDAAAATPGVTPLVPGMLPSGYALTQAAVAERAVITRNIDGVDVEFSARHVFEVAYGRGFDRLTVSTRAVRDSGYTVEVDPVDEFDQDWSRRARTEVPIASGAFAGVTARILVASTTSVPHLWAMRDGVLLTIAGAASAEELLAVAESLQVYPRP